MEQGFQLFVGEQLSALPLMFRFAELGQSNESKLVGRATEYWSDAGQTNDED